MGREGGICVIGFRGMELMDATEAFPFGRYCTLPVSALVGLMTLSFDL